MCIEQQVPDTRPVYIPGNLDSPPLTRMLTGLSVLAALPPLEFDDVPKFDYSFSMRVLQLLICGGSVLVFAGVMAVSAKLLLMLLGYLGDLQCKVSRIGGDLLPL